MSHSDDLPPHELGWMIDPETGVSYRDWIQADIDQFHAYLDMFDELGRQDLIERYSIQRVQGELPDKLLNRMAGMISKLGNTARRSASNA